MVKADYTVQVNHTQKLPDLSALKNIWVRSSISMV